MIAITDKGGVGKTIILLNEAKKYLPGDGTVLFVSLDDHYFSDHSLLDLAVKFTLGGGRKLLLDKIHKYPNWSP